MHVIPKGELLKLTLCALLRVNNTSKRAIYLFVGLFLLVWVFCVSGDFCCCVGFGSFLSPPVFLPCCGMGISIS